VISTSICTRAFVATAILISTVAGTAAQEPSSRAAAIAAEQADKATKLAPPTPSRIERLVIDTRRRMVESPSGPYPYFASVYSGGGFTIGAGFRQYYGDRTLWNLRGMYSIRNYKLIEFLTDSPGHAHGRVDLHARLGWRDATQVGYYGLGITSTEARSNYQMKQTFAGGTIGVKPVPVVVLGAALLVEDFQLESGHGSSPSIEEVFTPATAPGLGASPTYIHTTTSAGIDWRPFPGYARRGGLYEVSYDNYRDTDSTYSFDRLGVEIVQHIPILRENWVVSLHGALQSTLGDDDLVPYFLLPSLGGGSTLRGYPSWRFRDRHSVLAAAELRWIPNRLGLDMALFYDAGTVASRVSGFRRDDMKSDGGIGIRFHGPRTMPARIDLAFGGEGIHIVFSGSAAF